MLNVAESLNGKEGHSFAPSRRNNKLNCIVVPCNCMGGATRNLALHVTLHTSLIVCLTLWFSLTYLTLWFLFQSVGDVDVTGAVVLSHYVQSVITRI